MWEREFPVGVGAAAICLIRRGGAASGDSTGGRMTLFRVGFASRTWMRVFGTLLLLSLLLRVGVMFHSPLIPEEAYYWMYAEHPSLSYYDHPPMVAWTIRAGTVLFGDTEFGVRFTGSLLMLGASFLMYEFGRLWCGRTAGLASALLLQVLPMYFGIGVIATMESSLIFFWLLCLVFVTRALRGKSWAWYPAGLALGGAMLSKYTGAFLGAGTLLVMLLYRPWRAQLRSIHPYLAAAIAVAAFSPVIAWNVQHDWASFRFQFIDRFDGSGLSLRFVSMFIAFQVVTATPTVLWASGALLSRAIRRPRRMLRPRWLMAMCFSLPLLLSMALKAMRSDVHINWTLPAFLTLFPVICHMLQAMLRHAHTQSSRWWIGHGIAFTVWPCVMINVLITAYLLTLQYRLQWITPFGRWSDIAAVVQKHELALEAQTGREPLIVASGKYRLASVLAFYRQPFEHDLRTSAYTTSKWILSHDQGLGFPYWTERSKWEGWDCLYIVQGTPDRDVVAEMKRDFRSVELVNDPRLHELGRENFQLVICHGLQPERPER